jgi:DNA-binding transcriptional MerR regulator
MMKKKYYTTGELAKLTGVTLKTIRYYNDKGLLIPDTYSDKGYKQYCNKSLETLERILMFRYLDFSVIEIKKLILEEDISDTFSKQESLLQAEKEHIEQILIAVKEIQKSNEDKRWDKMIDIIRMTQQKEQLIKQYKTSDNLENRINIHSYSTSKVAWCEWVINGLEIKSGMKIIEIGCGTGQFWIDMREKLPKDITVILTDNSEKMVVKAKCSISKYDEYFKSKNILFTFMIKDAEFFSLDEINFDRIIANHMLYHVSNEKRYSFLKICEKLLKNDGMFFATTVGNSHLKELFEFVENFDKRIDNPNWMTENFRLENGAEQLKNVFSNVIIEEQTNDLIVPDAQAIYNYIYSWPGNAKTIMNERRKESLEYINKNISIEKPFFIHKSSGAFKAFKKIK